MVVILLEVAGGGLLDFETLAVTRTCESWLILDEVSKLKIEGMTHGLSNHRAACACIKTG